MLWESGRVQKRSYSGNYELPSQADRTTSKATELASETKAVQHFKLVLKTRCDWPRASRAATISNARNRNVGCNFRRHLSSN